MAKLRHDWEYFREEWINQNLVDREGPYTLKMLAEDHELDYSYLQNKSATEGWMGLLKDRRSESSHVSKNAIERSRIFNELEVRVRQATYGNLAQSKAAVKLNDINPKDLSIREAIDLMRLGAELERKALAMPDHFIYTEGTGLQEEDFTSEKAKGIFRKVINLLEQDDGTFAIDDYDGDTSRTSDELDQDGSAERESEVLSPDGEGPS